jgi:hypothetical protein
MDTQLLSNPGDRLPHWRTHPPSHVSFDGFAITTYSSYPQAHGCTDERGDIFPETGDTLKAIGLGRLKHMQAPVPVRRYQWARPGDMINVEIKQLARFDRVGHRITGNRRLGRSPGARYEKVDVAIDDATRLAYAEVLPDEKQATTVAFLMRAVAWFGRQGIEYRRVLSDTGSAYHSKP